MPVLLNVSSSDKGNLIPNVLKILEGADFCGEEVAVYSRLENLLQSIRDDAWFVLEYPYVDRHYRDTYYSFHSSKLRKIGRNCIRVHIFHGEVIKDDLTNNNADLDGKRYWGFFIIRPIVRSILGRSLISPEAFKVNNFVCCLVNDSVSLLGNQFTVDGFPHIAQDSETHTCAESSLWSFIEYYGSKYRQYQTLLPSQIIKKYLDSAEHRLLPSEGLTERELAKCLQNNGFQCDIYSLNNPSHHTIFNRVLQLYIESGIPLLLVMENNQDGHAMLAIGHEEDADNIKKHPYLKHATWVDSSFNPRKLVFIDDNMPPYQIADISQPTAHYSDSRFVNMNITHFIVPLPPHVFLVAEKAYALMKEILNTNKMPLKQTRERWITRLFLTNSRSFKNFINNPDKFIKSKKITCEKLPYSIKKDLLDLVMPRFIWIVELYRIQNYSQNNGYCSGLLIMDATGDGKSLASVLWYAIDDKQFTHNNIVWDQKYKPIEKFKMGSYRNNLKGEWNGWKS